MIVVHDIHDARVLQLFLFANRSLRSVGMSRVEELVKRSPFLVTISPHRHVLLLINGLKFSMEATYHHVHEAIALHFSPVFYLVIGHILNVASDVVASE